MGREIDARQEIEASLAAVQRLRERRTALVEELEEIDQSLENIHRQIGDILSNGRPASGSFPASQSRSFERKAPKKDPELTVNAAVLQVIRDAYKEISKSEIRCMNSVVCGNERMYFATLGCSPVSGRNSGTKCGLGRKRTSKTRSASSGTPCLNPKLTHETRIFLPFCFF